MECQPESLPISRRLARVVESFVRGHNFPIGRHPLSVSEA